MKISMNLSELFTLGCISNIQAYTDVAEIIQILGEPDQVNDSVFRDEKDGVEILSENFIYPNIVIAAYNKKIESIEIRFIGESRTKNLELDGYSTFQKINKEKFRELVLENGGEIVNDELVEIWEVWQICYRLNKKYVMAFFWTTECSLTNIVYYCPCLE